jgi:hypothetical protein
LDGVQLVCFASQCHSALGRFHSVPARKGIVAALTQIADWVSQSRKGVKLARDKKQQQGGNPMKETADRLCRALVYAGVVKSQRQFSRTWMGMSASYLSAITAMDGRDISPTAARNLITRVETWLRTISPPESGTPMEHAVVTGKEVTNLLSEQFKLLNTKE